MQKRSSFHPGTDKREANSSEHGLLRESEACDMRDGREQDASVGGGQVAPRADEPLQGDEAPGKLLAYSHGIRLTGMRPAYLLPSFSAVRPVNRQGKVGFVFGPSTICKCMRQRPND